MSMLRNIRRNKIRKLVGNNNISEMWLQEQVKFYGPEKYVEIRNSNLPTKELKHKFVLSNNGITRN